MQNLCRVSFPTVAYTGPFTPENEGLPFLNPPPSGPAPADFPAGNYYLDIPSPSQATTDAVNLNWTPSERFAFNGHVAYARMVPLPASSGDDSACSMPSHDAYRTHYAPSRSSHTSLPHALSPPGYVDPQPLLHPCSWQQFITAQTRRTDVFALMYTVRIRNESATLSRSS